MQVHHGEGVATHTGPESCVWRREASGEALTGEYAGQVVSGESNQSGVPMPSWQQKAIGADPIARGSAPPRVVWDPGMHRQTPSAREPGELRHRPAMPIAGPQREDRRS